MGSTLNKNRASGESQPEQSDDYEKVDVVNAPGGISIILEERVEVELLHVAGATEGAAEDEGAAVLVDAGEGRELNDEPSSRKETEGGERLEVERERERGGEIKGERVDKSKESVGSRYLRVVWKNLNRPTMASLGGILVGCSPLRLLFVTQEAPLRVTIDALNLVGTASIPLVLFTLGATLSKGPPACGEEADSDMATRTMFAVVFAKLVVIPASNLFLVYAASLVLEKPDKLMLVVMAILGASPTAMNMATISSVVGCGIKEMGGLLFWQYFLASITMSFFAFATCRLFVAGA